MSTSVIYPGTFDPITLGHVDLILRASKLFEKVVVAVSIDTAKKTLLPAEDRLALAKAALRQFSNVEVVGFKGLLVDFAKEKKITTILRGIRAMADFEYERQLASTNQHLYKEIETLFMAPNENYTHISSTFVRDIARLGGDVSLFVPSVVAERLKK
ncbi:MAG TPA: pantetheine-phosphate adenylyltransferase [Gammaproteobacteria bacterium]|nr:pantetheine-phosphate adenylyltransferase [Gammaproteobacteria bacterium]